MRLFRITGFLLLLYIGLCTFLYIGQDKLIFDPSKLPEDFQFRQGTEVEIAVEENIFLNCLLIEDYESKGVILYLHGNRGSNRRCLRQAEMMLGNGYDVFMPDYRGFGKSDGTIQSEKQLFNDAQLVYDHLANQYGEDNVVIVGYSLGTGVASYLAAKNNPKQLFLVAPYVSFVDIKNRRFPFVPDFLVKYPLNNRKYLGEVKCPVVLFHGTHDEVIPFDSSRTLENVDPAKIDLVELEQAGHRRSIFHNLFRSTVSAAL